MLEHVLPKEMLLSNTKPVVGGANFIRKIKVVVIKAK